MWSYQSNTKASFFCTIEEIQAVIAAYIIEGAPTTCEETETIATSLLLTPDGIAEIGDYAFCACTCLTTVPFAKVTSIGCYAFYNCTSLTATTLSENLEEEGSYITAPHTPLGHENIPRLRRAAGFLFDKNLKNSASQTHFFTLDSRLHCKFNAGIMTNNASVR